MITLGGHVFNQVRHFKANHKLFTIHYSLFITLYELGLNQPYSQFSAFFAHFVGPD